MRSDELKDTPNDDPDKPRFIGDDGLPVLRNVDSLPREHVPLLVKSLFNDCYDKVQN